MDENGLPVNVAERIAFLREVCEYMRESIDGLFGKGTSQAAFEGSLSLDAFAQFFEGITPFVQGAREAKIKRHLNTKMAGKVMK